MQPTLRETQRFSACIARFGQIEVLVIAVYGFATRHKEGIRPNDRLIANLIPVVMSVGLPFIIAGDFNEPLVKLPAYNFFRTLVPLRLFSGIVRSFNVIYQPHAVGRHGMILPSCILC